MNHNSGKLGEEPAAHPSAARPSTARAQDVLASGGAGAAFAALAALSGPDSDEDDPGEGGDPGEGDPAGGPVPPRRDARMREARSASEEGNRS